MVPMRDVVEDVMAAAGATTVTFTPGLADGKYLIPVKAAFTPGPDVEFVNATDKADFTGSTGIGIAAGARTVVTNPLTGGVTLNFPAPSGGFLFTATNDTNLPQTIHGVVLGNDSITIESGVVATALLPEPVTLTDAGDYFEVSAVNLTLPITAIF